MRLAKAGICFTFPAHKVKIRNSLRLRLYAVLPFHSCAMDRRVYLKKGLLMLLATALLIIGLLLVVYSADRLVFAASILCRLTGVPPVVIGMTVVSVGTSLPEIIVSVTASLHGQLDLAVGTAIGSNIVNILLILGLAALLHPFRVHSDVLRRELPLMLIVSLLAGCVFYDGVLSYGDGIFLLALAVIWLLYSVKIARLAEKQGQDSLTREQVAELPREGTLPVALLWLGVALIIMPMATRMVVDNATVLANYFAMSELTIGLTVIAIGTSLPELATAIAGARKGEDDIAIGNIIGSNIFNIAIVMGLPALITPGPFNPLAFSRDYGVMLLVSVIFALLCWRRQRQIGKGAGALLTGGFIVWMAMLYWLSPLLSG
ncbi:Inner membrane protein yrbG [Enterobacter ludwigii]|uniref:Inner membrane protein yrbG n=2 Tax=Enterobacter ludwigii TaxID=299767 RepID=G8LGF3_9ENTR|nr:Inner membrane protein yrbG [Enterobacter ludwigii]